MIACDVILDSAVEVRALVEYDEVHSQITHLIVFRRRIGFRRDRQCYHSSICDHVHQMSANRGCPECRY